MPKKPTEENAVKLKKGEALVLRTCNKDMKAHGGFVWPRKGKVKASDWDAKADCGNGLHGLLWGQGDGSLLNWAEDAVWMVVKVSEKDCVDLKGKVKFPACEVVYAGDRDKATQLVALVNPKAVVEGLIQTGGDNATMTGGNNAKMTGGDNATMTGGNNAKMTGGENATMTGGYYATMTGGENATMTGGENAALQFTFWDGKRQRVVIAYVGENGIAANKPYKLDDKHNVMEVK